MSDRLTAVTVTVRQIREKSLAVADGTMTKRDGLEVEKFFFLPRSMIELVEPEDYSEGDEVEITMPTWKLKEIGLI